MVVHVQQWHQRKTCKGCGSSCGLKQANYGLSCERKVRWCGGCRKVVRTCAPDSRYHLARGWPAKHSGRHLAALQL